MKSIPRVTLECVTSAQIAPLEQQLPEGCTDSWKDIARSLYLTLMHAGKQAPEAAQLAIRLALGLSSDMGGQPVYIPKGVRLSAVETRRKVLREFNGRNAKEVARSVGVSVIRVYQIYDEDREARRVR